MKHSGSDAGCKSASQVPANVSIAVGVAVVARSRDLGMGTYLTQSVTNRISGSYYVQKYLKGGDAFISSPQFVNSANKPLSELSASPVLTGSCGIHLLYQVHFLADSGSSVYVPGGSGSSRRTVEDMLHLKAGPALEHIEFSAHDSTSWFDTFTFTVPKFCRVRISGFETTYTAFGHRLREFLPDPAQVGPSPHL